LQCKLLTNLRPNTFISWKTALCSHILSVIPKSCTDLDPTLLYILILRTNIKFVWKNKMLALGACFPQPCSSVGRRVSVSRSRLDYLLFFNIEYRTNAIPLGSWSISRDITIPLVYLCVHRDTPAIPLGSLCIHRNAPSHKPPIKMPPSTFLPRSMFQYCISYNRQHGSTCLLSRCGVQIPGTFVTLWPTCVMLSRYVSSPVVDYGSTACPFSGPRVVFLHLESSCFWEA